MRVRARDAEGRQTKSRTPKVRPATRALGAPGGIQMKGRAPKVRPTMRRTFRALGGRRIVIEGFGRGSPTFVVIAGSREAPAGAWLMPAELRRFVEVARRILK